MLLLVFRKADWEATAWERRVRSHPGVVPRKGDGVNIDGEPFRVAGVAWCFNTEREFGEVVVYVTLRPWGGES